MLLGTMLLNCNILRHERIQVQQEYETAESLTAESLIAEDPSADLPEPSKLRRDAS